MESVFCHLPLEILNKVVSGHSVIRPDGGRAFKLSRQRIAALSPRRLPLFHNDGSGFVRLPISENRRLDIVVIPRPSGTTYKVMEKHRKIHRGRSFFVMAPIYGVLAFTGRCTVTDSYAECQWFEGMERNVIDMVTQMYPGDPAAKIPLAESHNILNLGALV